MFPLVQHKNRTIRVDQVRITENALARTFLIADRSAAGGTLTIEDIVGFAIGKYVWINPFGANSEIIAVHASTAPTGNTLTLAANTAFAHATGEEVLYVEFNQIEVSHAATVAGVKAVLVTVGMTARERELTYLDITQTTGFYFARFRDSIASIFSPYSDALPNGGWSPRQVGYMVDAALRELAISFGKKVTIADCLHWLNKGMAEIKGKLRNWPDQFVYDFVVGQAERGINTVAMPITAYDLESNRSIDAVRFGEGKALVYVDPGTFDAQLGSVRENQVRTQAAVAATSLAINNSFDFADAGVVSVYIANVKYQLTYTAVTRSTTVGVLTGIPASGEGSITVIIPVGINVWQNEQEGVPELFTVRNSLIEFWPLPSDLQDNENIYLDYNTIPEVVNSESDLIDFHRYEMLESYLTWRMWCKQENDSKLDRNNGYFAEYKELLNDAIRTMPSRKSPTSPSVNTMSRRRGAFRMKPDPKTLRNG